MSVALLEQDAALGAGELACGLRQRFEDYNTEFTLITRRAARHFVGRDWHASRADALQRIELYERHVSAAIAVLREEMGTAIDDRALWIEIKRRFALEIAGVPDSDFYRTFLNSITRDVFATVGVDEQIEFTATASGRASGSVPIRVHPVGDSLQRAVCEVKNLIEDMRCCADLAERRLTKARAHNTRSAPVRLRAIPNLPPPEPLTDDETTEMMRLLIRLAGVGVGRGLS